MNDEDLQATDSEVSVIISYADLEQMLAGIRTAQRPRVVYRALTFADQRQMERDAEAVRQTALASVEQCLCAAMGLAVVTGDDSNESV